MQECLQGENIMDPVYIIAEAGVNHNGDIDIAKKLIDVACDAGADAVKFQTFKSKKLVSKYASKAYYQQQNTKAEESQLDMIKKLELNQRVHEILIAHCIKRKIQFLSSAFDIDSIELLAKYNLPFWKIPSGEITNLIYLRKIGSYSGQVILSTGMADLGEIEDALEVLKDAGTLRENVIVLHCNTEYPTPIEDVNLKAMVTIGQTFKVRVGYSDHTIGIEVPIAAAAMGAVVIEKHFTLDKFMPGPDHKASLEPDELKIMISAIRNIEKALGDGTKRLSPSESKNKPIVRKSIVAARNIKTGEIFTEENISIKRPGNGISPMNWDIIIGKKSLKNYKVDDLIELFS